MENNAEPSPELVYEILVDQVLPALREAAPGWDKDLQFTLLRLALVGVTLLSEEMDPKLVLLDLPLPSEGGTWRGAGVLFLGAAWLEGPSPGFAEALPPEHRLAAPDDVVRKLERDLEDLRTLWRRLGLASTPQVRHVPVHEPLWGRWNTNQGQFYDLPTPAVAPIPAEVWAAWQRGGRSWGNWPRGVEYTPSGVCWITGLEAMLIAERVAAWVCAHPEDFRHAVYARWHNGYVGQTNYIWNPWVLVFRALDPAVVPTDAGSAAQGRVLRPSQVFADALEKDPSNALLPLVHPSLLGLVEALEIPTLSSAPNVKVIQALHQLAARPDLSEHPLTEALALRLWHRLERGAKDTLLGAPVPAWRDGRLVAVDLRAVTLLRIDDAESWSHLLPKIEGMAVLRCGVDEQACWSARSALRELLGEDRVQRSSEQPLPDGWTLVGQPEPLLPWLIARLQAEAWLLEELEVVIRLGAPDTSSWDARRALKRAQDAQIQAVDADLDEAIWRPGERTLYVAQGLIEAPFALLNRMWPVVGQAWREAWQRWASAAALGGRARRAALPQPPLEEESSAPLRPSDEDSDL